MSLAAVLPRCSKTACDGSAAIPTAPPEVRGLLKQAKPAAHPRVHEFCGTPCPWDIKLWALSAEHLDKQRAFVANHLLSSRPCRLNSPAALFWAHKDTHKEGSQERHIRGSPPKVHQMSSNSVADSLHQAALLLQPKGFQLDAIGVPKLPRWTSVPLLCLLQLLQTHSGRASHGTPLGQ